MQSFSWKRKKTTPQNRHSLFCNDDDDDNEVEPDVDWLTASKRPKTFLLEDSISKAKRLREEGTILAEEERWWEAINYWREVLSLTPNDHEAHDMIAQAYMKVGEIYPAVKAATIAADLCPLWWPCHQTLGRSQLGIGEVTLAIKSFSKAIRLAPGQMELWKEDLEWAVSLRKAQKELEDRENEKKEEFERENALIIEEIKTESEENDFEKVPEPKLVNISPGPVPKVLSNEEGETHLTSKSTKALVRFKM